MKRISVEEAKREKLLTYTHAKIMHKLFDNLEDIDPWTGLHPIGRLATFESLNNCLDNCLDNCPDKIGKDTSYTLIPNYMQSSIFVIIFGTFTEEGVQALAEKFNKCALEFNITATMHVSEKNDSKTKKAALQIFEIC